jgi:predicted  nucleic acid-binding Zn-ribbon protein
MRKKEKKVIKLRDKYDIIINPLQDELHELDERMFIISQQIDDLADELGQKIWKVYHED